MIPGSIFQIIDKSKIVTENKQNNNPIFMMGISSDKGPEDLKFIVNKDEFWNYYISDTVSYKRHGQALLQAARIMECGGALLVKRVVADDAKLANIALVAKVKKETTQKKDASGKPVYMDASTGKETTTAGSNKAVDITKCIISYEFQTTNNAKDLNSIATSVGALLNDKGNGTESVYPLFIISDIGRGVSSKKIKIMPDYLSSRYIDYMKYKFTVIENDKEIENVLFTINPDIIEADRNISLEPMINFNSKQIKCKMFEDAYELFIKKVAEISGNTLEYCSSNDILFGLERTNNKLNNIEIAKDAKSHVNLTYAYGMDLQNGSNGKFNDCPVATQEYEDQLIKLFNGEFTTDIYDLNNRQMDLIVDCCYPDKVKRKIEELVTFREDVSYFRDYGLNVTVLSDLLKKKNNVEVTKNKFIEDYNIVYDIIDPYTKKQIPVSCGYSLSRLLVDHFKNGRTRPLAGELYGWIISEAVEGTVRFIPKVTPNYNEKDIMIQNKINYASYYDSQLVIETLYTSQEKTTQLSFINNVLAVQEIIKVIRKKCPKNRYSFLDGKDLESYRKEVQDLLDRYSSAFKELKLVYVEDKSMIADKVFYATIAVKFKDFIQTEYFKIYALD